MEEPVGDLEAAERLSEEPAREPLRSLPELRTAAPAAAALDRASDQLELAAAAWSDVPEAFDDEDEFLPKLKDSISNLTRIFQPNDKT